MGRGRNRKPRNSATFRLCPRPGAADASDRVFVRVDANPYSVPGFAEDDGHGHVLGPSSSSSATGGDYGPSRSPSAEEGALAEHVRREILELGLPDDGYDYLAHLRELRPSLSSTGGGGSSAVFLPARRPARSGLPADVKAYDFSRVPTGPGAVAERAVEARRVEEAVDLDVARLLEESDSPVAGSGDEDLEEDFVIIANQPNEDEEDGGGKESTQRLSREQFDSHALDEYAEVEDDSRVRDGEHELSQEVVDELKSSHIENFYAAWPSLKEQIGESSNVIPECVGYAERYSDERREEEQVVLVPESSDGSSVRYCATTVSESYLDLHPGKILVPESATKKEAPKFSPGETSMKKAIVRKGIEKLPAEHLPKRT